MFLHLKNKNGFALVLVYSLLTFIISIVGVFFYTSIQSARVSQQREGFIRAFYAAESGIDVGLQSLPVPSRPMPNIPDASIGNPPLSWYSSVTIEPSPRLGDPPVDPPEPFTRWTINSTGAVPDGNTVPRVEVELEVVADFVSAGEFFDNALYSATNLTLKGNAYTIVGAVYYNEDSVLNVQHPENITDENGDPLPPTPGETIDFANDINWELLRNMAAAQEPDIYDHVIDVGDFATSTLPPSFWYDEAGGIPNIIYVEGSGDLKISGNITIGGLYIISSGDCQITGTVILDGCLMAMDDIKISGTVDATGGVWAGGVVDDEGGTKDGVFISGNITLTYDQTYMDAVETLNFVNAGFPRVLSWREIRRQAIQKDI